MNFIEVKIEIIKIYNISFIIIIIIEDVNI